jgi:hypothetical protein
MLVHCCLLLGICPVRQQHSSLQRMHAREHTITVYTWRLHA